MLKVMFLGGWRDGPMVKSTYCSCQRSRFGCQQRLFPAFCDSSFREFGYPLLTSLGTRHVCRIYAAKIFIYINKSKKKSLRLHLNKLRFLLLVCSCFLFKLSREVIPQMLGVFSALAFSFSAPSSAGSLASVLCCCQLSNFQTSQHSLAPW